MNTLSQRSLCFTGRLCWLTTSFLLLLTMGLITSGRAQDAPPAQSTPPASTRLSFEDVHLLLPSGWKSAPKVSGQTKMLLIVPPDTTEQGKFVLLLLPPQPLKGAEFKPTFENLLKRSLAANEHIVQDTETKSEKKATGYELLTHVMVVENEAGKRTLRVYFAANPNGKLHVFAVLADTAEALTKRQDALKQILSSITFDQPGEKSNAAQPAAPEDSAAPAEAPRPNESAHAATGSVAQIGKGVPILKGLWVGVGPTTRSVDGQRSGSPHIKDVAIDLTDRTVYAAAITPGDESAQGGVFASRDGGKSWTQLFRGNFERIVPTGTDRLYALTYLTGQIFTSADRGQSWSKCTTPAYLLYGGRNQAEVKCIAASPADPNILYAGAGGLHGAGLYKSSDAGRTWTRPNRRDEECSEIVVDPGMPQNVYAWFYGGAEQSQDGGLHFYNCLRSGEGAGPSTREVLSPKVIRPSAIQIDPSLPNYGYMRTNKAFYRTGDGGRHWTTLKIPGVEFVNTLALHPGSPQIVYAATEAGMYVSQDAGRTWSALQSASAPRSAGGVTIPYYFNGTAFNSVATVVSEDEPIVIDPQSGHLLYGTAIGVKILVRVKTGSH